MCVCWGLVSPRAATLVVSFHHSCCSVYCWAWAAAGRVGFVPRVCLVRLCMLRLTDCGCHFCVLVCADCCCLGPCSRQLRWYICCLWCPVSGGTFARGPTGAQGCTQKSHVVAGSDDASLPQHQSLRMVAAAIATVTCGRHCVDGHLLVQQHSCVCSRETAAGPAGSPCCGGCGVCVRLQAAHHLHVPCVCVCVWLAPPPSHTHPVQQAAASQLCSSVFCLTCCSSRLYAASSGRV